MNVFRRIAVSLERLVVLHERQDERLVLQEQRAAERYGREVALRDEEHEQTRALAAAQTQLAKTNEELLVQQKAYFEDQRAHAKVCEARYMARLQGQELQEPVKH